MNLTELSRSSKRPPGAGADAFGQMSNTLSGANKTKSSTGGTITKTPTGLVHTAKPKAAKPKAANPAAPAPKASNSAAPAAGAPSKELTKAWIQFLKNNQVVATQSDPKTGKLSYKKKVTTDMLTKFLKTNTHLDDETINSAIESVISKKSGNVPDAQKAHGGKKPGEISQTPNAIRKRNARAKPGDQMQLAEEFIDKPTEIDEKGVEEVFSLLQSKISDAEINTGTDTAPTAEVEPEEQLDKIKNIIKRMSPEQRKSLWQALSDTTLTEQALDKDDIRDVFIQASKPGFSRKRVDIKDLQQAWKDMGYTDDSEKIVRILKSFGYDDDARNKVFSTVFGSGESDRDSGESNSGSASKAIDIIMDHVNKSGLKKDLIAFMQKEYGEELSKEEEPEDRGWLGKAADLGKKIFGRKVTTEEVRQIFSAIVLEKRTMHKEVIREYEYNSLGRNKKVNDAIIDESVTLSDVLKSDQYIKILRHMKTKTGTDINVTRIKNQIIQSWKSGKKHSKHYAGLLSQIHLNIHDLIK